MLLSVDVGMDVEPVSCLEWVDKDVVDGEWGGEERSESRGGELEGFIETAPREGGDTIRYPH